MNPQRPREWGTSHQLAGAPPAANDRTTTEGFSTYAARRYALQSEIASGSVATVHLGRLIGPAEFSRTVAIKRLRPQYTRDAELVAMVLDGARLAGRVRHPNVVPTLDVVTGGELLVVMEYVEGESLATLLRTHRGRGTPAPLAIVSGVFVGLLRGLHAMHEAREGAAEPGGSKGQHDVTSSNVLVGIDGVARWIDLGVGRIRPSDLTPTEPPTDEPHDRRTDLFAAATMLWESLAGRQLLPRISFEGFEPPSRYREEIAPALDAIVSKGLAPADARFTSANEMALALEAAVTPATPAQIGSWVQALARQALDDRASLLAKVEKAGLQAARSTLRDGAPVEGDTAVAPSERGGDAPSDRGGVAPSERGGDAPSERGGLVTRRERVAVSTFDTRRGLGPDGAARDAGSDAAPDSTADEDSVRSSFSRGARGRKPRGVIVAAVVAAALAAVFVGRAVAGKPSDAGEAGEAGEASQTVAPQTTPAAVGSAATLAPSPPATPAPTALTESSGPAGEGALASTETKRPASPAVAPPSQAVRSSVTPASPPSPAPAAARNAKAHRTPRPARDDVW